MTTAIDTTQAESVVRSARDELLELIGQYPDRLVALRGAASSLSSGLAAAGRTTGIVKAGQLQGSAHAACIILGITIERHPEWTQEDSRVADVVHGLAAVAALQVKLTG